MRKQTKQFFQKGLCGILSAAMILTGSIIPDLSVLAAQPDVEDTADANGQVNETPSVGDSGAVQNPEADGSNADGNIDSGEGDEKAPEQPGEDVSEGDDETSPDANTVPGDEENDGDPEDDDTADGNIKDDGATGGVADDDDAETGSDDGIAVIAEDGTYNNVTVEFNFYFSDLDGDEIGFCPWGTIVTDNLTALGWKSWNDAVYEMKSVEGHENWYKITFNVTDTVASDKSNAGFVIYKSSASTTVGGIFQCSGYPQANPEIYTGLLAGEITAVKDGVGYASIEDAEVSTEALAELVAEAKKLNEDDYKAYGWQIFSEALTAAEEVLEKETPTSSEIEEAYENLEKAMDALAPKSGVEAEINVKPIALAEDFITGADLSSYWSLRQSGTVFKDENGNELSDAEFFQYLADGGTNWVRIRVWNDPYDSEGHGYGGGNNDLAKAKIMGKLATDAGMRVLIDFHYSDFWADPGKQQAPKAWADKTVDEKADLVYQFTLDSLNELKSAGVDVGMVQVGNETTNGICGINYGWADAAKIYNAGSKAVREVDKDCLVAIHFTNPERSGNYANFAKNLNDQNVDYDVFASSYYPFWHGTTENLTSVLANVAKTYGKKVMVAETSWATTLDDQDGHENTVRKGNNDSGAYAISVQGQADEIRAVVEAANNVNSVDGAADSSIGVFYWEPAWISPYYVYNEDGTQNAELLAKNKEAWETYGSGWASSYSAEYDPDDAGEWYGGSAIDNQAWFGFDGTALATAKVYSYIRTGATAEKAVSDVQNPSVTVKAGGTVTYPDTVTVSFNDGTTAECPVEWNQEDQAQVDTREPGDHTVRGIATCEYTISDGSTRTATRSVTLTITVEMTSVAGLVNPGFEDEDTGNWELKGATRKSENQHSGDWVAHFYSNKETTVTVKQTVKGLEAGTYIFGGYIEGANADADAVVTIYDKDNNQKGEVMKSSCSLDGWMSWKNPEIVGIVISEGDYLVVGMEVAVQAEGWGTMDDFYLYSAYEYDILIDDQIKHGTVSSDVAKSVGGETITLKVEPDIGYILYKLTVSGRNVTSDTLASENGTVTYDAATKTATLTYDAKVTEATEESFTMPNSKVTVSAVFRTDVELSGLNKAIEECESLTGDDYTEESWTAFTEALQAAKEVAEDLEATQTEIDKAKEALETAYTGLVKIPIATPEEIAALSALIEEYGELTSDGYTEESWKNFEDALKAAQAAVEKENVKAPEIASAKEALEAAYNGLAKALAATTEEIAALSALIEEYEKVTNDGYTAESWQNFADALAAARAAVKKEGVTTADISRAKAALEQAHDELTKASTGTVDLTGLKALIEEYKSVEDVGYTAESWKNFTDALNAAEETADKANVTQTEVNSAKEALEAAYAGLVREGLWMEEIPAQTYTGTAIKPDVKVYHGNDLLELKKDYTVAYKSNTNVGTATVTVTGKGNFKGKATKTFEIEKKDIGDEDIIVADVYAIINNKGKVTNPKVTVKYGKKTLKLNSDYRVEYPSFDLDDDGNIVAKDYKITIYTTEVKTQKGKLVDSANYTGSREITYTVCENDIKLMSKATITLTAKSVDYADRNNSDIRPAVKTVKFGKVEAELNDFDITYKDENQTGKATITVTGKDKAKYYGSKSVTYDVKGTKLAAKDLTIEGINAAYDYTGEPIYVSENGSDKGSLTVTRIKGVVEPEKLTEGTDYEVSYKTGKKLGEHTNVGTVTVTITGINAYTGSINKTF
ncbi:MAG: cellulase family glycosylhydrolase, partial [Lachnospiraceae bacterium]|nr:cellulase family glycosylhydrolase [Lachnospiraceae bacterium]